MALTLLDVDSAALHKVVLELSGRDLCQFAATCRLFRDVVFKGRLAIHIWRRQTHKALSDGLGAVHSAAAAGEEERDAHYWRQLYGSTQTLNTVRWWRQGTMRLRTSVEEADKASFHAARAAVEEEADKAARDDEDGLGSSRREMILAQSKQLCSEAAAQLRTKLARTGHSATLAGRFLVIMGGIIRDGCRDTHVVIIAMDTLEIAIPEVHGSVPSFRFRHSTVVAKPAAGSLLQLRVAAVVGEALDPEGHLLLMYAGYDTRSTEFGGSDIAGLWVHGDGRTVTWVPLKSTGTAPCPRHHHTAELFADGAKMLLFGGEGPSVDEDLAAPVRTHEVDGDSAAPTAVACCRCYVLDINMLEWTSHATNAGSADEDPGARSLHCTTVRNHPVTGREELVMFGGYRNGELAEMHVFTLDLETWRWEGPRGPQGTLPCPRQRTACVRVTNDWLLMLAGGPMQGELLDDLQRLHVPTLTWMGPPPEILGRPGRALRSIAGHSLGGLVAFGGCIATALGIVPIAKMDVLLLGKPPPPLPPNHPSHAISPASPSPAAAGSVRPLAGPGSSAQGQAAKRPGGPHQHTSAHSSSGLSWGIAHGSNGTQQLLHALGNPAPSRNAQGPSSATPLPWRRTRASTPQVRDEHDPFNDPPASSPSQGGENTTNFLLRAPPAPRNMTLGQTSMGVHQTGARNSIRLWRDPVTGAMYVQHTEPAAHEQGTPATSGPPLRPDPARPPAVFPAAPPAPSPQPSTERDAALTAAGRKPSPCRFQ
ncbi:hypothetical protein WJX73_004838 [Symbiochloris irregularis]|uniref:F-box domain-containing protein n=1 Tax=Symbiochloris irregularis TaxID=706552 RepID=A0AAW1NTD3_9CHLO